MARYVGKRIVPKHCGYWDNTKEYEMENIVYDSVRKAMSEVAPKQQENEEEVYISAKEACEYLGIKTTALYDRLKLPGLRSRKENGRRMVCLNDLKKLSQQSCIGRYARYKRKS